MHGSPNKLVIFTSPLHLPKNHLPDIHVHKACLEWWLWLLFSVPPTGQIPVLPTLAMGLDGILKQAVSWKLKPFWEAGLGGWDNWHSDEWEEKEKQRTSCWGKCNERGERDKGGEREGSHVYISAVPCLGVHVWRPEAKSRYLLLTSTFLVVSVLSSSFFLSLFCLCFWDRFSKLVVWLDWLACKAQRSAFISQTYPYHKGVIADTHLHTWLSPWVLGSKPTSSHLLPHPISHPLGHLPSPPESYKDQLHQRTRKMSQNSNWCAHTKQKDRNASPPSVWQNHSALEGAPYRAQGSVEGTLAATRLCEMCAVLRTLYLYVWRVDNAVLS